MKKLSFSLLLVLCLSACMRPTTRHPPLPSLDSSDMRQIRREIVGFSHQASNERRYRISNVHYNLMKSTGQELCDRRLLPDIGVDLMRLNRLKASRWFNPNYQALKDEHDDVKNIYHRNVGDVWIENVYKNSAAAKAGLKKGDRLVRLYGVDIPVEGKVFEKINDLMIRHSKDGLPVDVEVERNGRPLSFSIQPDMICPYKIFIDTSYGAINAFADGDRIFVTQELIDYVRDDNALAAVIAHELAHNTLGHNQAQQTNMGLGMFIGALTDIFTRSNGEVSVLGAEIGAGAYSKEFEMEADYLSLYYLARAGYDYKSAGKIQKYLAARDYWSVYRDGDTHPVPQLRYALLKETAKEIDLKKAFKHDLVPDFERNNAHLQDKKDISKGFKWF